MRLASGYASVLRARLIAVTEFGGYATTPVVSGNVMYTQDLESDVQAIDVQSGKILWTTKYNSASVGPNGVTVANGVVFGATAEGNLIALGKAREA